MKENNILPAHHPSSLNIHTVNNARFHIQAQQGGIMLEYTALVGIRVGLGSLLSPQPGTDCEERVSCGFLPGWRCTVPRTHSTNLTLCVPKLERM